MKFLIVSALLSAALLVASSPVDSDLERSAKWESFKAAHGKEYSPGEELVRKTNFLAVDALIQEHNNNPHKTFTMAHNSFSDLHDEEKQALLGTVVPSGHRSTAFDIEMPVDRAAPAAIDLRTSGCVGPVKNQASCGSCWTFSAIAPLEYSYCNLHGKTYVSLSEQQIVSCDAGGGGCNGGWPDQAWSYIQSAGGVEPTSAYPYTSGSGSNGACLFSASKVKAQVASHGYVSGSLESAVSQYGVLSVAITVVNSFYNYKSGVYTDSTCTSKSINHGVAIVGYGSDSTGTNYWIVRNSWSSGWGAGGYILMKRGVNMCNIEKYAYYVVAK